MMRPFAFVASMMLLLWGGVAALVSTWQLLSFFGQPMDFSIESYHQLCEQPLNNRCVTHYVVSGDRGQAGDFVPFGYEFEPDELVVGTTVEKKAFSLSYTLDGTTQRWPYLWQHLLVSALGVLAVVAWYRVGGPGILRGWLRAKRWP